MAKWYHILHEKRFLVAEVLGYQGKKRKVVAVTYSRKDPLCTTTKNIVNHQNSTINPVFNHFLVVVSIILFFVFAVLQVLCSEI